MVINHKQVKPYQLATQLNKDNLLTDTDYEYIVKYIKSKLVPITNAHLSHQYRNASIGFKNLLKTSTAIIWQMVSIAQKETSYV